MHFEDRIARQFHFNLLDQVDGAATRHRPPQTLVLVLEVLRLIQLVEPRTVSLVDSNPLTRLESIRCLNLRSDCSISLD